MMGSLENVNRSLSPTLSLSNRMHMRNFRVVSRLRSLVLFRQAHSSRPVMFDPPVNYSMRELDRNAFQKEFPLAAMRVLENRYIAQCRADLGDSLLVCERMNNVRPDPDEPDPKKGKRVLLLDPKIKVDGRMTGNGQKNVG